MGLARCCPDHLGVDTRSGKEILSDPFGVSPDYPFLLLCIEEILMLLGSLGLDQDQNRTLPDLTPSIARVFSPL